jgi:hypothetical protein
MAEPVPAARILALTVMDGFDSSGALGIVMVVSAGLSTAISILFAVALRRSR